MPIIKHIISLFQNYNYHAIKIIIYEIYFSIFISSKFNSINKFSNELATDPIPITFYLLNFIFKDIYNFNPKKIIDLGCGYGKVLYYFGKYKKIYIVGFELNEEIYTKLNRNYLLKSKNIEIQNKNFMNVNLLMANEKVVYIYNDPLKKISDFNLFLSKFTLMNNAYIYFINLDEQKIESLKKKFSISKIISFSNNRSLIRVIL